MKRCRIILNSVRSNSSAMHEWALVEAVIASASEIAEKEGLKEIIEIKIKLGELQQLERDILEFAFSQLKTAKMQKADLVIDTVRAELQCRICKRKWSFNKEEFDEDTREAIHFVPEIAHSYVKCPQCGSPDFEITQGRGVVLESIKGV